MSDDDIRGRVAGPSDRLVPGVPNRVVVGLLLVVPSVWSISQLVAIAIHTYSTPVELHSMMTAEIGAILGRVFAMKKNGKH